MDCVVDDTECFSKIVKKQNIRKTCVDQLKENISYWQAQQLEENVLN